MAASIEVTGLDKAERELLQLGNLSFLLPAMDAALKLVHSKLIAQPARYQQDRKRWWFGNAKKRKFFFEAVKRGAITTPYERTGNLIGNWKTNVVQGSGIMTGDCSNRTAAAPWVQSSVKTEGGGPQARIHQKRWPTVENVAKSERARVVGIFANAINRETSE